MSAKHTAPRPVPLTLVEGGPVTMAQTQGKFRIRNVTPAERRHPAAEMLLQDPLLDMVVTMSSKRGLSQEWRKESLTETIEALSSIETPFTVQL